MTHDLPPGRRATPAGTGRPLPGARLLPAMLALALAGCPSGETGTNPIIPRAAVEAVEVRPGAIGPLAPGGSAQLAAVVTDPRGNVLTDRVVTWASSASGVATVNSAGLVTAVAPGTATISAISEGKVGSATVTVRRPVASVVVNPATLTVAPGFTSLLTAVVKDAAGTTLTDRAVTWTSMSPSVATVSSFGTVMAVAPGQVVIWAVSEGVAGNAAVTVQVPVATVAVSPSSASLTVGSTQQLTATARDASGNVLTGRAVTWSSGNTGVATVSASGVVTGVGTGTVTITATSEGRSGTATITVTPVPVATVTVSPASASLTVGNTQQLTATARDAAGNVLTGRAVTWSSGNTGVATVSASGVVTGVGTGTVTITATSEGRSGTATITVSYLIASPGQTLTPGVWYSVPSQSLGASVDYYTQRTTTATFTVRISGGTGDADLAVWSPSGSRVCYPYDSGNTEVCTVGGATGFWRIQIIAYYAFSGLFVRVE